ncbi:ABC transporter ATP-binding protein [Actinomadura rubrobrunea]|uniref:ABC transporter ATP-binding protein n=1 Tax=Actinomadura rubrobrunea TaxID=115335 RepID=A0A9W6PQ33_9ACTN|nr:ABC transporter ATP-binding protein [Actinomadura rubrobrunea]GLW62549.1 ABC transporter ATP-binding protein [Actinomadura rubrobrunea]
MVRVRRLDLPRSAAFAVRLAWRADRRSLVTLMAVQLVTALGLGAGLLLLRTVLDGGLPGGSAARTAGEPSVLVGLAVLLALRAAGGVLGSVTTARQRMLSARLDRHVISLVLGAAVRADLPRFEDPAFHDRLQRAVFASRGQPVVVITTLVAVLQALLTAAAVSGAFLAMAWWLLPFAALSAVPTLRAARAERNASYGLHHGLAESRRLRQYFERLMTGRDEAKEVRALDLGPLLHARWHAEYEREIEGTVRTQRRHMRRKIGARLVGDLLIMAVVGAVALLLGGGLVDLPTALTALTGLWLLSARIQMVGGLMGDIGDSALYLKDLRAFTEADAERPAGRPPVPRFRGLRAERITFTYPGSTRPALKDVSVTLRAGEIVALVGTNGSGKTTLAKILAGLYRPDAGALLFNDRPLADPAALRAVSAVVFQDFVRYKLSALDNIAFGRADEPADEARAAEAARKAGAHGFVSRLARGYATVLGKEFADGEDLSGGQWQRLALARAFYRDAPLVILDEPTAALDPQAEEELFRRIRSLFAGRTVLLISHRFSSVRGADRIYVLDEGSVIEQGTHDELMARGGRYAGLFLTQAAAYLDAPVS